MGIIIAGSFIFVYGLLMIQRNNMIAGWIASTAGLSVALYGVCKTASDMIVKNLADQSISQEIDTSSDT